MAWYLSYCQYPDCTFIANTEVALRNCPKNGGYPKGDWIALCDKHRYILDKIRIELWRTMKWQPRKKIELHRTMLADSGEYQGESIGEGQFFKKYIHPRALRNI